MQLPGVPDRLQENSIYLHTIYQLSSTDGLILRQSPCSSPTSHHNESLLQGIKQGSLLLLQIFPQTGKEEHFSSPDYSGEFWRSLMTLCLFSKKTRPTHSPRWTLINVDTFLYPPSLLSGSLSQWGHLWKQTSTSWGLGACLDILNTLLDRNKRGGDLNGSMIRKRTSDVCF